MSSQFAILNPCSKLWSDLAGEGRKRFCSNCQTYIFALDRYSAKEIEDLRRQSEGRLCGYLEGESLPLPRSRRAVLMGALLTTISPLMAQSGRVRIRVTDPMGAAAQGAEASLSEKDGKTISAGRSDEVGEIILTGIPIGIFQIRVSHPGYKIVLLVGVPVLNADEQKLDVKLEVGEAMGVVSFKKRKRWWIFH